jgi:hypothetical protein
MKAMSVAGNAVLPPILDYSGFLPPDIAVKLTIPNIPKIAAALNTPNPLVALKALNIDLGDIPSFIKNLAAVIPAPAIPSIPTPPIPDFDFIVFPDLFAGLIQLPFTLLPDLIAKFSPIDLLKPSFPDMFKLVLDLYFGPLIDLLKKVGLLAILPKLLVATFIVIIQSAVTAMVPLIISQIIGTGIIVKTAGQALGLT